MTGLPRLATTLRAVSTLLLPPRPSTDRDGSPRQAPWAEAKLMRFYAEHAAPRDRFEFLWIGMDSEGALKSMADVDRALEPIVKHVWGGQILPFPILLDPTFKTWERFGLPGLGTVILIDPEGKLTTGDED